MNHPPHASRFDRLRTALRGRRHRAHLHKLSDHTLRDIGIARDDIDRATRTPRR